jgi:hypothetical protein
MAKFRSYCIPFKTSCMLFMMTSNFRNIKFTVISRFVQLNNIIYSIFSSPRVLNEQYKNEPVKYS